MNEKAAHKYTLKSLDTKWIEMDKKNHYIVERLKRKYRNERTIQGQAPRLASCPPTMRSDRWGGLTPHSPSPALQLPPTANPDSGSIGGGGNVTTGTTR